MSAEEEKVKSKHDARAERAAAEATRGQQEAADMTAEEASQAAVAAGAYSRDPATGKWTSQRPSEKEDDKNRLEQDVIACKTRQQEKTLETQQ